MRSLIFGRKRAAPVPEPGTYRPVPRDPSPSLWTYRMNRMLLTPLYRRLLRVGLPAAVLVMAVGWYVSSDERMEALTSGFADMRNAIEDRPEFMVTLVAVEGASPELAQAVRDTMPVHLPVSSFDLDLDELKEQAESLGAVERARLRVRPGGVLEVVIEARQPAVLWRDDDVLTLLDKFGNAVAIAETRTDWPDLPLIAGDGAETHVSEALDLISAAAPLRDRLRGLVRVGERRWDVVLDREQQILLPERDAIPALERLIALHEARDMLDRDIALVDLRNPNRPTLRLNGTAIAEMQRIRSLHTGGTTQ